MERLPASTLNKELSAASAACQKGDWAGAIARLEKILAIQPRNGDALALTTYVYLSQGRFDLAEGLARKFAEWHPNDARPHSLLADALGAQGRPTDGLASIENALAIEIKNPDYLATKARLLMKLRSTGPAIATYREAASIKRSHPAAFELARILLGDSHPEEALAVLEAASTELPVNRQPHLLIAQALTQALRLDEAEARWAQAERQTKSRAEYLHTRANAETAIGRFELAEQLLRQAIDEDIEPESSFFLLTRARRMTDDDRPLIARAEAWTQVAGLDPRKVAKLHYALGKSHDDLADYERAIRHYDEANRVDFSLYPFRRTYGAEEAKGYIDRLIRLYTAELIKALSADAQPTNLPLFVVGMVRSGTTLTETILGRHPKIKAGGEQLFWTQRAPEFLHAKGGIDIEEIQRIAREYLSVIDPGATPLRHVIDKNPTNIQLAPILHGVYPNAKFIHLQRNPVDNLLSMWMTPFDDGVRCASNKENLVSFYREYRRLLAHIDKIVPPERFQTIRYEDLTSNPETTVWRMLDHAGLEFEPACLEPEKHLRVVLTPSVYQVRQAIHPRSQGRWKNYEPWLGAFADLLAES